MVCRRPGVSPSVGQARRSVKAGLKVSRGLTSEASARARAMVDSSVAAQLRSAEATSAATKMPSMWGRRVVQENGMLPCREVTEHWVSNRVPPRRMGREAALTTQATRAGRASCKRRLFRMGRKEVKMVATSASRAAMMNPCLTAKTRRSSLLFSVYHTRKGFS